MIDVGRLLLEKPPLDRRQRHFAGDRALFGALAATADCHSRKLGDGRVCQHLCRRQPQSGLTRPRDDLNAQDRIATKLEEIIVDTDVRELQHAGPYLNQPPLGVGSRRRDGRGLLRRCLLRLGQPAAVNLAAARPRKLIEQRDGSRSHIIRQPLFEEGPQTVAGEHRITAVRVSDKPTSARRDLCRQHHGFVNRRVLAQGGFDLAKLNAVASHFYLLIVAAQAGDLTVRVPARHVARPV